MTLQQKSTDVPRLALRGVTKQYPGTLANDSVDLTVMPGEIHALLGENGAGKSTLVKYIYGLVKADAGETRWNGALMDITSPKFARDVGIGMVFQHFSLFDSMTVLENVALGISPRLAGSDLAERIVRVSEQYGLPLSPQRYVYSLSVGERQRIEIVRCLLQEPKLLIMDEPTSVLTPQEAEEMFVTLRKLAAEGVSILYISHKLEEVRRLCHTATIMRGGRVVAHCEPSRETAKSLAEMMIGTHLKVPERHGGERPGAPRLMVRDLSLANDDFEGVSLKNISFQAHAGEILGIAGVAGNGQGELMAALSGETICADADAVVIEGSPVGRVDTRQRRALGAVFAPEERMGHAAVPDLTLWENAMLTGLERMKLSAGGFLKPAAATGFAQNIVDSFRVKTDDIRHNASSLSGGNLQKFIIGREVLQNPTVFVALQPTWGVDAGAAAAIHQSLIDLARNGAAVVVISQDLDEIFAISNRVAVIADGRLSSARPINEVTVEQIGLLMGGTENLPEQGNKNHAAIA